ncbi:uncharacterized protein ISCGN_024678 [Ixodes scapularis]
MEMKTLGAALALTFVAASLVAHVRAQSVNDDNYKEVPVGYDEATPTPREADLSSPITTCQPRSVPGQRCTGVQVESPFYLDYCPCLKGKEKHGVWYEPDPYTRCKVSTENVSAALVYFMKVDLQCSRQGPNQKDAISVMLDGEKTFVLKRFLKC